MPSNTDRHEYCRGHAPSFSNRGEVFCRLNDQAAGARYLQEKGLAGKILIVDPDVHKGNGTAAVTSGDSPVATFSMHGAENYPFKKELSNLDIPLGKGTGDLECPRLLKLSLPLIIDEVAPDFIFYLCGVGVVECDKLGTLSLSPEGCRERERFVLEGCHKNKFPEQCSMGGGYSPEIKTIVETHANTFRLAQ